MAEIKQKNQQEENSTGTFLGIDFGQSKIGLAIADEETKIAFAFDTLKNDGKFWKKIREICQKENVKMIIIGVPSHKNLRKPCAEFSGVGIKISYSESEIGKFGNLVEEKTGIKVEYEEEMFTTKMAQAGLKERGAKNVSSIDDSAAARIILQSWLDKAI